MMMRLLALLAVVCASGFAGDVDARAQAPREDRSATVIVVVGAPGSDEYGKQFAAWAARWKSAADRAAARFIGIGPLEATASGADDSTVAATVASNKAPHDRDLLREAIGEIATANAAAASDAAANDAAASDAAARQVWIVLIGHGTFDGKRAKFNLRGDDVTAEDLAEWLRPVDAPLAIVNCASASGPFINRLSGANRVVVTATKSGNQYNFARFGDYLSAAIGDAAVDLDKDRQTSLLEAYLAASARTAEFYKQESRLATEHSLLDDNGDALGTPADWFRGWRAVRQAKAGASVDGELAARFVLVPGEQEAAMPAELAARRDSIESQIEKLRRRKTQLDEAEYYSHLEALLLELAACYEEHEQGKMKNAK